MSNLTCVVAASCPIYTFASIATHICESCGTSNCLTCSAVNVCTNCSTSFYLFSGNSTCLNSCPSGTYPDITTNPQSCTGCPN